MKKRHNIFLTDTEKGLEPTEKDLDLARVYDFLTGSTHTNEPPSSARLKKGQIELTSTPVIKATEAIQQPVTTIAKKVQANHEWHLLQEWIDSGCELCRQLLDPPTLEVPEEPQPTHVYTRSSASIAAKRAIQHRRHNQSHTTLAEGCEWCKREGLVEHPTLSKPIQDGVFKCNISIGGRNHYIGIFKSQSERELARAIADRLIQGPAAITHRPNFPPETMICYKDILTKVRDRLIALGFLKKPTTAR